MVLQQEGDVLNKLIEDIDSKGWKYVVHIPGAHQDRPEYREIVEENQVAKIPIGGSVPDVIGFNSSGEVFAIEAKGDSGANDAFGSALTFQQGVHKSYVAAPPNIIDEVESKSSSSNIGKIKVEENDVRWTQPSIGDNRTLLSDVRAQLKFRLENWTSMGSISSQRLSQPVNYLSPVLIVGHNNIEKTRLFDQLRDRYDVDDCGGVFRGSLSLGLIEKQGSTIQLTDSGNLARAALNSRGISSSSELIDLKEQTSYNQCLYTEDPVIGTLMRKQYREHPEFRHLDTIIEEFDMEPVPLTKITRALAREYPNSFVNIFVSGNKEQKARRVLENKGADVVHSNTDLWRELMLQNIYDNFTRQLRQIGILDNRTRVYNGPKSEFDPTEYPWIPRHDWF